MTTKMLINSTRAGQLRVAVVDGTILQEYQTEIAEAGLTRGNIYRGVVANIQPSLNAAFIDLGEERHGFLPVADVQPTAYHKEPPKNVKRPKIDQVLEKGKTILVQVTKDGVGQKGPALNTNLAIAGRYLVLTPYDGVRGISRKAQDDDARKKIKDRLKKLNLPDGHGTIVRTNGLDQNQATLNRDLNALLRLWKKISTEADRGRGPKLVYSDQDLVVQAMRDYLDPGIAEVIVDDDEVHAKAEAYMKAFMPRSKTRLVRYEDRLPLFSRYRLETQIDRIYERSTSLPSGGTIVIDQTEALTAIDVNSSRATKTANHDDSIFKVNCEAAEEVARQLRLRDIGGLVVIDFIDMRLRRHQS
ncbi:MAG: Rne/Rng family ribonuclease, partial [Acidobacteriota bacterium]